MFNIVKLENIKIKKGLCNKNLVFRFNCVKHFHIIKDDFVKSQRFTFTLNLN